MCRTVPRKDDLTCVPPNVVRPRSVPRISVDEKPICSYLGLWPTLFYNCPSMFCRISIHSFGRKVTTVQQRGEHALLLCSEVCRVLHQFREAKIEGQSPTGQSAFTASAGWRLRCDRAPDRLVSPSAVVIPKRLYIKLHHCIINHLPYSSLYKVSILLKVFESTYVHNCMI